MAEARLWQMREEYENTPPSYRGYLLVGICTCLESHIKYYYAAAAEAFDDHPDLLRMLYTDIQVDIDTLISATTKTFALADVVAASISVSSLSGYRDRASHFFSVLTGQTHVFPWDHLNVGTPELKKEYARRLERLERVFEARHKFVHETDIAGWPSEGDDNPLECVDDALWLTEQFENQYYDLLVAPQFAAIKENETVDDAVARTVADIDRAFDHIEAQCESRQHESLSKLKNAFLDYLWARCDFQASVFIVQKADWARALFLDLAPEYRWVLSDLALKQRFMLAKYPIDEQEADLLDPGETGTTSSR